MLKKDTAFFDERKVGDLCKFFYCLSNCACFLSVSESNEFRCLGCVEWTDNEWSGHCQKFLHNCWHQCLHVHHILEECAVHYFAAIACACWMASLHSVDQVHIKQIPEEESSHIGHCKREHWQH